MTMRRRFNPISLVILIGFLVIYLFQFLERSEVRKAQFVQAESGIHFPKWEKSQKIVREIISAPRPELAKDEVESQPFDCESEWNEFLSMKLNQALIQTGKQKLPDPSKCRHTPDEMKPVLDSYLQSCEAFLKSSDRPKSDNEYQNCVFGFSVYRATINDRRTKDLKIDEILDLPLLMDKVLAAFGMRDFARMQAAASRLQELSPDLYDARKAVLVSQVFQVMEHPEKASPTEWDSMEKVLEGIESFRPKDASLWDMRAMVKTKFLQNIDSLEDLADEAIRSQPESGMGHYMKAAALWGGREKFEDALEELDRALAKEPKNERFLATKKKILEAGDIKDLAKDPARAKDLKAFTLAFGFSFNLDEKK